MIEMRYKKNLNYLFFINFSDHISFQYLAGWVLRDVAENAWWDFGRLAAKILKMTIVHRSFLKQIRVAAYFGPE